ncbi:phosphatidate cytidylyltransferase [Nitratireductor kimnyeongensis]|uniref:Phosphatidate cytidylyltransferase n=1 Tax=Nitratireductor kimnyeongensis TaxID=430679 RepID=A0ABW0T3M3_9HYPH|nr:phosphatidate cytidylyltransferase [Nitratireductor kimnyeongensis]QZZ35425.1 phosphatidate cytidylyltransferase [Nitratireductor kimnyeongensis]
MNGLGEEGKPASGRPRSNLQLRIVSAIILGLAVLLITYFGGLPFRIMSAAMAGAIFYEWCAMRSERGGGMHIALGAALLAAIMALMILGQPASVLFLGLVGALLILALHGWATGSGFGIVAGLAYAATPTLALVHLRVDDTSGLLAILFLFAVVWTTDIMAYFTGRTFGGAKLAPSISPGKTWSGAVGGTVFAVLAGGAFTLHENAVHSVETIALIAFILAVVSQVGDLFESALKRKNGVKDSSNLIPGHGGVMDRVDGLLAAALALYVLAAFLGGTDHPAQALFKF